jgi:cytochrome c oxidase subunit 2
MTEPIALVETRHEYEHLFGIYVPIALGVFVAIVLIVVVVVVVFRRRTPRQAARWHENNLAEGGYAVVLVCVIAFLLYVTFSAEHQVDTVAARERPQLIVNVYGAEWEWHFNYPTYGIDRYSGTVGHQALVLPTGEAIRLRLISQDVIHEFWVPELRYKHDLIPGSVQTITVTFPSPGSFPGQCAEFCGLYHSKMTFTVQAVNPTQFEHWAAAHAKHAAGATPAPTAGGA